MAAVHTNYCMMFLGRLIIVGELVAGGARDQIDRLIGYEVSPYTVR